MHKVHACVCVPTDLCACESSVKGMCVSGVYVLSVCMFLGVHACVSASRMNKEYVCVCMTVGLCVCESSAYGICVLGVHVLSYGVCCRVLLSVAVCCSAL